MIMIGIRIPYRFAPGKVDTIRRLLPVRQAENLPYD